ncbi:hypothetical protein K488DRAFT_79985 [Vararia minispora EC-137]|uniref:Uncharacterized protein n=1 Tax=Vararia minispora EC-137 TaxID=1314806 RepID=A0ACB8QDM1_9AGAM|nr:hypothetical protein K488DRAFT_79985 [Vararia minispora EC-137]
MCRGLLSTSTSKHGNAPVAEAERSRDDCLDPNLTVSIPPLAPSTAVPLSQTLLSLSIEQDRWPEWVGVGSPNTFFLNALDNIAQLAGEPPRIRIGADSEDHTNFSPDVQISEAQFPSFTTDTPYPEAANIIASQDYYNLVSLLPSGTKVIWGVNLGGGNLTALGLGATAIGVAFQSQAVNNAGVSLQAIEVGNEPDLYAKHGLRAQTFTIKQYVQQWTLFAKNALAMVNKELGSAVPLQALSFAKSTHQPTGFSPQSAFQNGLLNSPVGKGVQWVSQHHYSGSFCSGSDALLQNLMTKNNIRSNLTAFLPDIAAVQANGLSYVLGETNSFACHGAPGVSDTAGAALWALDYTMFAAQIGIERLYFHHGIGYKYNFIQPVTLTRSTLDGQSLGSPFPPHIQPAYYAAIIAAEAISNSGATTAVQLNISNDFMTGYAFYEGGQLARALLINLKAYTSDSTTPREAVLVSLTFGEPISSTTMTVKRLSVPYADSTAGLTWGGQTYETGDARISGGLSTETASVSDGVTLSDTEVVMLTFD